MKGFIKGKPGLPHFNYPAMVCEKFLGYVFEVPPEVLKIRDGIAAASTVSPSSVCYSCHKVLTPLAYQPLAGRTMGSTRRRSAASPSMTAIIRWSRPIRSRAMAWRRSDAGPEQRAVYPHSDPDPLRLYFRARDALDQDARLYKRLWETERQHNYQIKGLIRAILTSPIPGSGHPSCPAPPQNPRRKTSKTHTASRK